ncbi:MAG: sulfatase [Planctomycetes bacterium]|nr:sulfatase [Planctomycetota bacterium]
MNRRSTWVFASILFLSLGVYTADAAEKPPNIVLIISDDQAWTDFGCMGHPVVKTPNIDRLAAEGVLFRRGYVTTSLCRPSLATIITGLYPHQHKICGNDPAPPPGIPRRGARRNPEYLALCERLIQQIEKVPTLPRLLAEKGYLSLQTGKWWEGHYSRGGFTDGMTHGDPKRGGRHGDEGLKIGREGMQPIFDFIEKADGRPFFVWYAPFLPHQPHTPPERLLKKYQAPGRPIELAKYYAMCEWFDETCGQLIDFLDRKGLSENTLVLFVVDNGWIQRTPETKEPRGWRFRFAPKSKRSPYDGGIRTPIILRWPGKIQPAVHDTLVSSIDLAPTILAAVGLEKTAQMPGVNLLDVIAADGRCDRKAIFGEIYAHDVAEIGNPAASLQYRWCISGRWKLILPADASEPVELYELQADPHETRNLARSHPDVVERLRRLTDEWWNGKSKG